MCAAYGYTQRRAKEYWAQRYAADKFPDHDWQRYNIRPSQESYVIIGETPRQAVVRKFGVPAPWDEKHLLLNAQSETVAFKRSFRKMLLESRCLIPADVFYEWKKLSDVKQPYAFGLSNGEDFSFAGICNDFGYIILTTKPNNLIADVHNRMPVILERTKEEIWLNPDTPEDQLLSLLTPLSETVMKRWPISSLVNKVQNDFPEILKPVQIID